MSSPWDSQIRCPHHLYPISMSPLKKPRLTRATELDCSPQSISEVAPGFEYQFLLPYRAPAQRASPRTLMEEAEAGRDDPGRAGPKPPLTWLFLLVKYKLAQYHLLIINTLHFDNSSNWWHFYKH